MVAMVFYDEIGSKVTYQRACDGVRPEEENISSFVLAL